MLNLFSFYHLNISFSSIEENLREEVIRKCYWPLLKIIESNNFGISIELTGYTLEVINKLDKDWVKKLSQLLELRKLTLIGSGYSQLIGPLVPWNVNLENLKLGNKVYEELLGVVPKIALVNEQAYSSGLIELYIETGYKAIIIEWNNSKRLHPEWNDEMMFHPQTVVDQHNNEINIIWNNSSIFQQFQRTIFSELSFEEFLKNLNKFDNKDRYMCLYGNDAEIFDFRPGRFKSEEMLSKNFSEWDRILKLYKLISELVFIKFISIDKILNDKNKYAFNRISIEAIDEPIIVKKQPKYNILRWAMTGRNDLFINTKCWQLFNILKNNNVTEEKYWKELCYLWSSDFRTHITDKRWSVYIERLSNTSLLFENLFNSERETLDKRTSIIKDSKEIFDYKVANNRLLIKTSRFDLSINLNRGLAVDNFVDKKISKKSLFGTINHGNIDDVYYQADFYSGHLVVDSPGRHKVTDLLKVTPKIQTNNNEITISAKIENKDLSLDKKLILNAESGEIKFEYNFKKLDFCHKSIRLGFITLNSDLFDFNKIAYKTKLGGKNNETYNYKEGNFDHGKNISMLVSSTSCFGLTDGKIELSDGKTKLALETRKDLLATVAMASHQKVDMKYLSRVFFSLSEIDDTSNYQLQENFPAIFEFKIKAASI